MFQVNEIGPYLLLIFPLTWRKPFKILKRPPFLDPRTPCPVWSLPLDHMLWLALLLWSGRCLGPGSPFEGGSAEGRDFQVQSVLTGTHATTSYLRMAEPGQMQAKVPTDLPPLPLFSEPRDQATACYYALCRHEPEEVSFLSLSQTKLFNFFSGRGTQKKRCPLKHNGWPLIS